MKILITGGAGFLGTNLSKRLLNEGHEVVALDNFQTSSRRNIEELLQNPNYSLIEHNVIEPYDVAVDQIYNLACPASPPRYQADPIDTAKISFMGAINALELAKKYNARVFQASTSEVYGDPIEHPQPESYRGNVNPIGPRACYDEGKRIAETLFTDYRRMHGLDIRIVRIFNTYGPFMHEADGRVVSNFIVQALQDQPITIYGDGTQTRSFCFVDDLIDGFVRLMNAEEIYEPVNIGNPYEFSMLELAEKVIELTGAKSQLTFEALPQDDPLQRKPVITEAKAKLGWEPKIQLAEGLQPTIDYFRGILADLAVH